MTVRYYSSVAPPTTLSAGITAGSASIQVGSTTGFPALTPYTLSLDYGTSGEELVQVNSVGGTTLAVTRAIDGTSATSHLAGAVVRHVSSARDFTDSRNHENADQEIHGLGPGEEIVGTEKVQTLSNKTLDMAEGTLNRVDIFNTGGWTTTINGDVGFPSAELLHLKPDASSNPVLQVNTAGQSTWRNTAGGDAAPTSYKFRVTKTDGTTNVYYVLTGGTVRSILVDGVNGREVQGSPDNIRRMAFRVVDLDGSTTRSALYTEGTLSLASKASATQTADIVMAPAQSVAGLRIRTSALAQVFAVSQTGVVSAAGVTSTGAVSGTTGTFSGAVSGTTGTFSGAVSGSSLTNTTTGFATVPTKSGNFSVTFASATSNTSARSFGVTFPSIPSVVCNINDGSGTTSRWQARAINVTTTGFTLFVFNQNGDPASAWTNIEVQYIAVSA